MDLSTEHRGGALIVSVHEPRVDAAIAIQFKDKMREVTADWPARVILDMSQVDFLDSSGLGAVVTTMKQLGSDQRLELCSLTPTVAKVFRLTRMDSVFTIHNSPEDAVGDSEDAG